MNTNNPKQITLKEFEELAESFVQSHYGVSCSSNRTLAKEFLSSFKSFAFKEEFEKESRRKEYEKAKEDYLKLKEEFEVNLKIYSEQESFLVNIKGADYISKDETQSDSCADCCFVCGYSHCIHVNALFKCSEHKIIWAKK